MKANRSRDTAPELALRSLLHRSGLRYRVNYRPLKDRRNTVDIVFTKAKVAVFVDGCFWHGCPQHHQPSKTNTDYWGPKIERNRARDADFRAELAAQGWAVLSAWEHENSAEVAARVSRLVSERRPSAGNRSHEIEQRKP